mmetsp:Transcript_5445/g.10389  ORF Transcript_5445/g.10389 Transcript_5445/m.10389 type:complete len:547 (+) Transcript_5445:195-1835(+)
MTVNKRGYQHKGGVGYIVCPRYECADQDCLRCQIACGPGGGGTGSVDYQICMDLCVVPPTTTAPTSALAPSPPMFQSPSISPTRSPSLFSLPPSTTPVDTTPTRIAGTVSAAASMVVSAAGAVSSVVSSAVSGVSIGLGVTSSAAATTSAVSSVAANAAANAGGFTGFNLLSDVQFIAATGLLTRWQARDKAARPYSSSFSDSYLWSAGILYLPTSTDVGPIDVAVQRTLSPTAATGLNSKFKLLRSIESMGSELFGSFDNILSTFWGVIAISLCFIVLFAFVVGKWKHRSTSVIKQKIFRYCFQMIQVAVPALFAVSAVGHQEQGLSAGQWLLLLLPSAFSVGVVVYYCKLMVSCDESRYTEEGFLIRFGGWFENYKFEERGLSAVDFILKVLSCALLFFTPSLPQQYTILGIYLAWFVCILWRRPFWHQGMMVLQGSIAAVKVVAFGLSCLVLDVSTSTDTRIDTVVLALYILLAVLCCGKAILPNLQRYKNRHSDEIIRLLEQSSFRPSVSMHSKASTKSSGVTIAHMTDVELSSVDIPANII